MPCLVPNLCLKQTELCNLKHLLFKYKYNTKEDCSITIKFGKCLKVSMNAIERYLKLTSISCQINQHLYLFWAHFTDM